MVLRAGLEPARITPHAPQTCAATNYATSAFGKLFQFFKKSGFYLFAGAVLAFAGAAALAFASTFAGAAAFAFAVLASTAAGTFASTAVFDSITGVTVSIESPVVCITEIFPVRAGIESRRAESIKQVAAAIVSLDKTLAAPRGVKAVLETLLVKSAPASVLPGCSRTAAINTIQETKNNPYKK